MDHFQTLIFFIALATLLVGVAQKFRIPYPIALVVGGGVIGFIPGVEPFTLNPNLILVIVLPPILYYASFQISFREFKRNWKEIFSLALTLVFVTTFLVGLLFKWLFPQFPWAIAFAFGAIVSPPDAIAATTIMKRFTVSPKLLAIIEGESLVNDASALVLYKLAIVSLLSGIFSWEGAIVEFLKTVTGGILLASTLGLLIQKFSRKYLAPVVAVLFSFTIPYMMYITADHFGVSGVLAVVGTGLIGSRMLAKHPSSLRRVLGLAVWDIFAILMNCFVFILIGLQLRGITKVLTPQQLALYSAYGALITAALIVIRLAWISVKNGIAYVRALGKPSTAHLCPRILKGGAIIAWSGMRGIVSLAAALAIPHTLSSGQSVEGLNEVIFITYVVILLTLILPSSTLSFLIRWLKIEHQSDHHAEHFARKHLAEVATKKLDHLYEAQKITEKERGFLNEYFSLHRYILEISSSKTNKLSTLESIRLKVFQAQRQALLEMWEKQEIDDKVFRELERELDIYEDHMARAEIN